MLILAAAWLPACVPNAPPKVALDHVVTVPDGAGLVIWVDGLGASAFERLRSQGRLPNITRYLIDRGVTVESAVTSLPTITYANNVSYATGMLPGHHGITDNKWFDPYTLAGQDYTAIRAYRQVDHDFIPKTIYECLYDEFTVTILSPVRRGVTRPIDNWATAGVAWFFGLQKTVNHLTTLRFDLISELARLDGRWPKYIFAYYATPDTVSHKEGLGGRYEAQLLDVDEQLGHLCRSLQQAGLLDKLTLALVSDHGVVETPNHTPVVEFFRGTLGLSVKVGAFGRERRYEERLEHLGAARAMVNVGGDRHCAIHLRPHEHWWQRPTEEEIDHFAVRAGKPLAAAASAPATVPASAPADKTLPQMLAELPATDLVLVRRGPDSVRVQNAGGIGLIERRRNEGAKLYRYAVAAGADPLDYAGSPAAKALMDGLYHDADAWLSATLETSRPDCVVQLLEMNDSPRSGDIVLFARDGWDFRGGNRGGHGGLTRGEIIVPWIWAGPGLPAGAVIRGGRTVDLMPTMLELIKRSDRIPANLDGRSLADRLRKATPAK